MEGKSSAHGWVYSASGLDQPADAERCSGLKSQ